VEPVLRNLLYAAGRRGLERDIFYIGPRACTPVPLYDGSEYLFQQAARPCLHGPESGLAP